MNEFETIPHGPEGQAATGAHWTICLPALVVALTWTGVYFWAGWQEPPMHAIQAIALVIDAIVAPLLLVHAVLRARVLRARVSGGYLEVERGFPFRQRLRIALGEVVLAQVRRSPAQRYLGGGALALIERSGKRHLVADLARPEEIAAAINETNRRKDAA